MKGMAGNANNNPQPQGSRSSAACALAREQASLRCERGGRGPATDLVAVMRLHRMRQPPPEWMRGPAATTRSSVCATHGPPSPHPARLASAALERHRTGRSRAGTRRAQA